MLRTSLTTAALWVGLAAGCTGPVPDVDTGAPDTDPIDTDTDPVDTDTNPPDTDTDPPDTDTDTDPPDTDTDTDPPDTDTDDPALDWPGGRHVVTYDNGLGETITGVLFLPDGLDRVPVVTVLHGSGGLFKDPPDPDAFDPATDDLERQFRDWLPVFEDAGYGAFFPASFYSRGSFDWNDDPLPDVDKMERLWLRTHDATAAQVWLCTNPRVDCARTAVVGFSNGGSTLLLSLYDGLPSHPDFADVRFPRAGRRPVTAIAYYPGCGLHGFVSLGSGDYRPVSPLWILHGDGDSLLENCETRVAQSKALGGDVTHTIYADAGHSFDTDPRDAAEEAAKAAARAATVARISAAFGE